jgi:hypothetical protein
MKLRISAVAEKHRKVGVRALALGQFGVFVRVRFETGDPRQALADERRIAFCTLDHGAHVHNLQTRQVDLQDLLECWKSGH